MSDPANPVPFTDEVSIRRSREYMVEDQRFASRRPDVLEYTSEALDNDTTIAGPLVADLFASTSGTDADFVVKVIDVFPNDTPTPRGSADPLGGLRDAPPMGDHAREVPRELLSAEAFTPGEITPVRVELNDVLHTFKKGHRIMVQIQSSLFPLADRNPQTFTDIYAAKESDFRKATIRLYHSAKYPSHVTLGVLP